MARKKGRKTFDIKVFVEQINDMLEKSTCSREERMTMCLIVENVLHDSGNYNGYGHLESAGRSVNEEGYNIFEDDTRRCYFIYL